MIICQLGRQPELSMVELTALYPNLVKAFGHEFATVDTEAKNFDIQKLGGTQKAGLIHTQLTNSSWESVSENVKRIYGSKLESSASKITLGISVYGFRSVKSSAVTRLGISLKNRLKTHGVSVRLIPNKTPVLSTATSHHNKLGLSSNKIEIMIVKVQDKVFIADSLGTQNITAYAKRDQARPARDAFVGMLPPKLAQIMLNIALGSSRQKNILDPFCGTGVVLQEALLMGHSANGSDLSEKMVDYTTRNIEWLRTSYRDRLGSIGSITQGDAMTNTWSYAKDLDAVVCEGYLGQPFSATPSPSKLHEVKNNCNHIMGTFIDNIISQVSSGTRVVVALPAWRNLANNKLTRLPLVQDIDKNTDYIYLNTQPLIYYRDNQVVARDIIILEKR